MLNLFDHVGSLTKPENNPQAAALPPMGLAAMGGGDDPETPMAKEMRALYNKQLKYDNNRTAIDVARGAAKRAGVDPAWLLSSAFGEGYNKAIAKQGEVSKSYSGAGRGEILDLYDKKRGTQQKISSDDYPVDGFYNYGLDTFGSSVDTLKKKGYIPADFDYSPYQTYNEANELVTTGAFRNNEDALVAKAAMMRDRMDTVREKAKAKGVELDDEAAQYLTLAAYNGKTKSSNTLFDEYIAAKDKKAFIEKGLTSMGGIHKNISPRMKNKKIALELLNEIQKKEGATATNTNQTAIAPPPEQSVDGRKVLTVAGGKKMVEDDDGNLMDLGIWNKLKGKK